MSSRPAEAPLPDGAWAQYHQGRLSWDWWSLLEGPHHLGVEAGELLEDTQLFVPTAAIVSSDGISHLHDWWQWRSTVGYIPNG